MEEVDHRALGHALDLFHQQDEGPGMVFWHPRGWALYRAIEGYVQARMQQAGFREIRAPQLLARSLWERSGHWDKFGTAMFSLDDDGHAACLKPMSCPCHVQVFGQRVRSHRELPVRYAEFGAVHRAEPSGALHGLMRARAFTQDDAHVFCAPAQVVGELVRFCALLRHVYEDFGFERFDVALSTRPVRRAGDDAMWDRAEALLAQAAEAAGLAPRIQPGEGAFYGPKLEFQLTDRYGRSWQCGTAQLDYVLPERLDANYIGRDGAKARPVMIHHAVLGSLERFIGILLEHHDGWLPGWLAPDQIVVANVGEREHEYASRVATNLADAGLRVLPDLRAERLPRKIVDARAYRVPVMAIVGAREAADGSVTLRRRDGMQATLNLDDAIARLREECASPAAQVELLRAALDRPLDTA
ncbi:threonine--tRNA ligase [Paraburkholderia sp.]|uniref:threonine--tRNA ligase n=1 Tax=Paraburkholderia sp. TaxID=1926495 RepID=UPI003D6E6202